MTSGNIREVFDAYAETHDAKYFAPDAVFTDVPQVRDFTGREAIHGMLDMFYHGAFADAWADVKHKVVDTERNVAALEFVLNGRHTADLGGLPPTGRTVQMPMLAIYEFRGDQIQRGRLYYDKGEFFRQLGVGQ